MNIHMRRALPECMCLCASMLVTCLAPLDGEVGVNNRGKRERLHCRRVEELIELRSQCVIECINAICVDMEPVALWSIPGAGIALKDSNINLVPAKRLCEAETS